MAADGAHHLHAGALAVGALDIYDFVALPHAQIDWLLNLLVQIAHGRQRHFAYVEPGLDEVAEFEEAHAQAIAARLGAIDEAAQRQVVEDAVRGRWMQARAFADLFQRHCLLTRSQNVNQREHALQHLNAWLGQRIGSFFFHEVSGHFRVEAF